MTGINKAHYCISKQGGYLQEQPLWDKIGKWTSHIFHGSTTFFETMTSIQMMVCRFRYLAGILSKFYEVTLSFQRKQLTIFYASNKLWGYKEKIILENFYPLLWS